MEADGDGTASKPLPPTEGLGLGGGSTCAGEGPLLFGVRLCKEEKQEGGEAAAEAAPPGGGEDATPPEPPATPVSVRVGKSWLRCPLCSGSFKPPIYLCGAGHLACCRCRVKLPDSRCVTCRDGGGGSPSAYAHCPALDLFFRDLTVPCAYEHYGCTRFVPYSGTGFAGAHHQATCAHAPCICPEPGCNLVCSPPALAAHLAGEHAWPVDSVAYSTPRMFAVPVPHRRLRRGAADGDDGAALFAMAVAPLGEGAAVSVVRVRAKLPPAHPRFACTFYVAYRPEEAAGLDRGCFFATFPVRSSALADGDGVVPGKGSGVCFAVPREAMHEGEAGRELIVSVRIDRSFGPEPRGEDEDH